MNTNGSGNSFNAMQFLAAGRPDFVIFQETRLCGRKE